MYTNINVYILGLLTIAHASAIVDNLRDAGLKHSAKYRAENFRQFILAAPNGTVRTRIQKVAACVIIFFAAVQKSKTRVRDMSMLIGDPGLRTAVLAQLNAMLDKNSEKSANVQSASRLSIINVAAAFRELGAIIKMMMCGTQDVTYVPSAKAFAACQTCTSHMPGAPTAGGAAAAGASAMTPLDQAGANTRTPGATITIRAYLASTNATQLDLHVDVRNEAKRFSLYLWEDVIKTSVARADNTFDDTWYGRTAARDAFMLPTMLGVPAVPAGAPQTALDTYAAGLVATANAAAEAAGQPQAWGTFPPTNPA